MRQRLSIALSVAALLVAVLGATPYAEAHGVVHALFAHNADKVDGLHASKSPRAGRLLPLGAGLKFPASVIPAGAAGQAYSTSVASASVPDSAAAIASLDLGAGKYVIWAKGWFQNAGAPGLVTCTLTTGAQLDRADFTLPTSIASAANFVGLHEFGTAGTVELSCSDGGGAVDAVANDVKIAALKVATLATG
ncbi:MAG: hypothetical protein ACRDON_02425 [Gaiellaceae bacterium]